MRLDRGDKKKPALLHPLSKATCHVQYSEYPWNVARWGGHGWFIEVGLEEPSDLALAERFVTLRYGRNNSKGVIDTFTYSANFLLAAAKTPLLA